MSTLRINLLKDDISVEAIRDHVESRVTPDEQEATRFFVLTAFGEISVSEFVEKYEEIHSIEPSELEIELVEQQRRTYESVDEDLVDNMRTVLFYIYGSNSVTGREAQRALDEFRRSNTDIDRFEVTLDRFLNPN